MTVAIIGAGASGILAARALHRRCPGRELVMIDPHPPGGAAYRAPEPWHLLNSRAAAMGDGFLRWAGPVDPDAFLPRRRYGDYLRVILAGLPVDLRADRAVRITRGAGGLTVHLAGGLPVRAAGVVLALGPPGPVVPAFAAGRPGLVPDPWAPGALDAIDPARPVVVAGTGLTAVDVALTLLRRGRSAPITLVSRRGLLPRTHQEHPGVRPDDALIGTVLGRGRPLRSLVRGIRDIAASHPGGWQPVIDAVRPHVNALWAAAAPADRDRFLRHGARHWDVHRHRMAAPVAAELARHRASGAVRVRAAGVPPKDFDHEGVQVVNATGSGRPLDSPDPLTAALVADGLARIGPHGLGLDVAPPLWLLGPLRRGRLWETTAIPEIRQQADALADALSRPDVSDVAA
ncbi:FAD/NAD(P)-binding protein [Catenuloplanes indicus]|uniref:NAD(P)/FAD-binding protein YdhS n=1 Tax=Catenuloplanes indicus TaxID=137267 RepID=A0AAE3W7J2_9ACTN|nr:FAD/NAD(P)-binding protein [Catenuloplanes indicus]MDQ0370737.1 putative NAD(P)/FAD-binding protein YdhS [Catenuloplanes indicus]